MPARELPTPTRPAAPDPLRSDGSALLLGCAASERGRPDTQPVIARTRTERRAVSFGADGADGELVCVVLSRCTPGPIPPGSRSTYRLCTRRAPVLTRLGRTSIDCSGGCRGPFAGPQQRCRAGLIALVRSREHLWARPQPAMVPRALPRGGSASAMQRLTIRVPMLPYLEDAYAPGSDPAAHLSSSAAVGEVDVAVRKVAHRARRRCRRTRRRRRFAGRAERGPCRR
jgi:hypothetical protein